MSEERKKILEMLSQGKISADEAEKLLDAISPNATETNAGRSSPTLDEKKDPKFLRVLVELWGTMAGAKKLST